MPRPLKISRSDSYSRGRDWLGSDLRLYEISDSSNIDVGTDEGEAQIENTLGPKEFELLTKIGETLFFSLNEGSRNLVLSLSGIIELDAAVTIDDILTPPLHEL